MDAICFLAEEQWIEKDLWATKPLATNSDDVAIRELVGLLFVRALVAEAV